jgi:hypothetical protein
MHKIDIDPEDLAGLADLSPLRMAAVMIRAARADLTSGANARPPRVIETCLDGESGQYVMAPEPDGAPPAAGEPGPCQGCDDSKCGCAGPERSGERIHATHQFWGVPREAGRCGEVGVRGPADMVNCPDCLRAPDAGDLVTGQCFEDDRTVTGLVVGAVAQPAPMRGLRYDVRTSELTPGGWPYVALVHSGVTVLARVGDIIICNLCGTRHRGVGRFLACALSHARVTKQREAQDQPVYRGYPSVGDGFDTRM